MVTDRAEVSPVPLAFAVDRLTPREREVMALVARGCIYKGIGDRRGISHWTVASHVYHIYDRLGARNGPHAVYLAFCACADAPPRVEGRSSRLLREDQVPRPKRQREPAVVAVP